MIIDRKHVSWGIGTAIATLFVSVVYLANDDPALLKKWHLPIPLPSWLGPSPPLMSNIGATPLGLIYGTIALLIFIFAALLGARRNHPTWPGGQIKIWLRAHVWLTIFTVPLVLFHCGFHGGGPMTQFLLWLYALVMISGFWGLFLQNVIPRLMREQLPEEVIFEQIPFIRGQLIEKANALRDDFASEPEEANSDDEHAGGGTATRVADHSAATAVSLRFIDEEVVRYLTSTGPRPSPLRQQESSDNQFRLLKLQVPAFMHTPLEELQDICDEKRRLDLQTRLHYWLHGWLIIHAPSSLLLVVLTIVHAIVAGFLYD
jgi:hypothetical protein